MIFRLYILLEALIIALSEKKTIAGFRVFLYKSAFKLDRHATSLLYGKTDFAEVSTNLADLKMILLLDH